MSVSAVTSWRDLIDHKSAQYTKINEIITAVNAATTHSALTNNPHDVQLDQLGPGTGDSNFVMATKHIHFTWTSPTTEGGMILEGLGNFTGKDLLHIHQHTGTLTGEAHLVHLEWVDNTNIVPLCFSDGTYQMGIRRAALTGNQTITFPDNTGTVALLPIVDADVSDDIGAGGATLVQLEDLLMFGSGNAAWISLEFAIEYPRGEFISQGGTFYNNGATDCFGFFYLAGMPLVKGSLNLWISGIRLGVNDADGSNYITRTRIFGLDYNTVGDLKYQELANLTAQAEYYDGDGTMAAVTAFSTSGYRQILVIIDLTVDTGAAFDIVGIELECYYV